MAVSKGELQVTWPTAANNIEVDDATNLTRTSEEITFSATSFMGDISLSAKENGAGGASADGDTVTFYVLYSSGDPDGALTDEFDDVAHATKLVTLDPFAASGNDAQKTVPIRTPYKAKIYAVYSAAGTAHYNISATIYETKA